jgi:hypothetical protein
LRGIQSALLQSVMLSPPAWKWNDRADPDVLGESGNARPQTAHSAHDQVDRHTGRGGVVQRADDPRLDQRVHLGQDPGLLPPPGRLGLAADELEQALVQPEGSLHEALELACSAEAGELLEDRVHVLADRRIAAHQAEVGVLPGGLRVVVSRPQVDVAPEPAVFAPDDQERLRMGLEPHDAVDDPRAGLLQPGGEVDVPLPARAASSSASPTADPAPVR